jgi:meso-butanediol dehydrogenase / (S,S)-butanediol dehydrogenase / diacetyl reductase
MLKASGDPARMRRRIEESIPLGGVGEPEDVAAAVACLASDDAKFMTGLELP